MVINVKILCHRCINRRTFPGSIDAPPVSRKKVTLKDPMNDAVEMAVQLEANIIEELERGTEGNDVNDLEDNGSNASNHQLPPTDMFRMEEAGFGRMGDDDDQPDFFGMPGPRTTQLDEDDQFLAIQPLENDLTKVDLQLAPAENPMAPKKRSGDGSIDENDRNKRPKTKELTPPEFVSLNNTADFERTLQPPQSVAEQPNTNENQDVLPANDIDMTEEPAIVAPPEADLFEADDFMFEVSPRQQTAKKQATDKPVVAKDKSPKHASPNNNADRTSEPQQGHEQGDGNEDLLPTINMDLQEEDVDKSPQDDQIELDTLLEKPRKPKAKKKSKLVVDVETQIPEEEMKEQIRGHRYRDELCLPYGMDQFESLRNEIRFGKRCQVKTVGKKDTLVLLPSRAGARWPEIEAAMRRKLSAIQEQNRDRWDYSVDDEEWMDEESVYDDQKSSVMRGNDTTKRSHSMSEIRGDSVQVSPAKSGRGSSIEKIVEEDYFDPHQDMVEDPGVMDLAVPLPPIVENPELTMESPPAEEPIQAVVESPLASPRNETGKGLATEDEVMDMLRDGKTDFQSLSIGMANRREAAILFRSLLTLETKGKVVLCQDNANFKDKINVRLL